MALLSRCERRFSKPEKRIAIGHDRILANVKTNLQRRPNRRIEASLLIQRPPSLSAAEAGRERS